MSRRVYFSFDYRRDIKRADEVRHMVDILPHSAAGFHDTLTWKNYLKMGDSEIAKRINEGLKNTIATVICVGATTASSKYVEYELNQSLKRGNAIVAIAVNHLRGDDGKPDPPGQKPYFLEKEGIPIYRFEDCKTLASEIAHAVRNLKWHNWLANHININGHLWAVVFQYR